MLILEYRLNQIKVIALFALFTGISVYGNEHISSKPKNKVWHAHYFPANLICLHMSFVTLHFGTNPNIYPD